MLSKQVLVGVLAAAFSANLGATELLTNGNFATGDLTGWNTYTEAGSNGGIFVVSGTTAPDSGNGTVGPPAGSTYYALTDQHDPGAYAFGQTFTIDPAAVDVVVSFDLFANDYAGTVSTGPLDYTNDAVEFATADLLTGTAALNSTNAGDIVQNFYLGADNSNNNPNGWTTYTFDITGLVTPGQTYQLRFGEADNQGNFNLGVADVSVEETLDLAPEPVSILLVATGLGLLYLWRRRTAF